MTLHKMGLLAALLGCSSGPPNFQGTYTVTLVSGPNPCNYASWTTGNISGIAIDIMQMGRNVQISATGILADVIFDGLVGTSVLTGGYVDGNTLTLEVMGSKTQSMGNCKFTVTANLTANVDSHQNLTGMITFTPVTNGDPSCTMNNFSMCSDQVTFSGPNTGP